jgi:branched-chain amino acid transport system ATP-binding protein
MITLEGNAIGGMSADEILPLGLAMVPEGRRLFPSLSVEENLLIGTYGRKVDGTGRWQSIYELFPILAERRHNPERRFRADSSRWSRSVAR